jgi:hypothetical protein
VRRNNQEFKKTSVIAFKKRTIQPGDALEDISALMPGFKIGKF